MPEVVTYWLSQNFRNEYDAPHPSKGLITGNWCNELDIFSLERREAWVNQQLHYTYGKNQCWVGNQIFL
jgi:hypothetical protein